MAKLLLVLKLLSLSCIGAAEYSLPPWGFRTGEYTCGTGKGVTTVFKVNITDNDIAGLKLPTFVLAWKKEAQGLIEVFIEKDKTPSVESSTIRDSTDTCAGFACWSEAKLSNVTAGTYYVGFSGRSCTGCSTQSFRYLTPYMADGSSLQQFKVTNATRGWTRTYRLNRDEVQSPYAKIELEEDTVVYVELDSYQDYYKALISMVFQRNKTFGSTVSMPLTEDDDVKSFPHPGGTEVSGEWKTGAYKLKKGTWYVTAVGGDRSIATDFQLRYGIGSPIADGASKNGATYMILVMTFLFTALM